MAKFSLKGTTVSIGGVSSCVESGDIDFGERALVDTTCSTDRVKTYDAGTLAGASGSVTINSTTALADWLDDYEGADPALAPAAVTILFTWADTGTAAASVSGYITNVSFPVGTNQALTATFSFKGSAVLTFTP